MDHVPWEVFLATKRKREEEERIAEMQAEMDRAAWFRDQLEKITGRKVGPDTLTTGDLERIRALLAG